MRRKSAKRMIPFNRRPKKKGSFFTGKVFPFMILTFTLFFLFRLSYHYRSGLAYYFSFKSNHVLLKEMDDKRFSDIRNYQVLGNHGGIAFGVDVSEYQGKINWSDVDRVEKNYPIDFVFVRATVGTDRLDKEFDKNWLGAKNKKLVRGAYHYYRPNENSLAQAALFIKTVFLKKGDLPPVLDIERLPENQSLERLKIGLRRWLKTVEAHYKVKPIIYTGERYYNDFLKEEFSDYLFWIANYNFHQENIEEDWLFWQFTEKGEVTGIKGKVDINIYNGDIQQLRFITVE
jgi:lysozyme